MNCPDKLPASWRSHWDHLWLGPDGVSCAASRVEEHGFVSGLWFVDPGDNRQWSISRSAHISAVVTIRATAEGPMVGLSPPCRVARPEPVPDPCLGIVLHPWLQAPDDLRAVATRLETKYSQSFATAKRLPEPEAILTCLADRQGPEPDPCMLDLVGALVASPTRSSLEGALRRSGLTARSFRRKVGKWFGFGPDALRRILRAEAARRCVGFSHSTLSQLAVDLDYADQPHMTREFVRFCGVTPVAWRNHVRQWCRVTQTTAMSAGGRA